MLIPMSPSHLNLVVILGTPYLGKKKSQKIKEYFQSPERSYHFVTLLLDKLFQRKMTNIDIFGQEKTHAWYLKYSGGRWPKGKREVKKIQQKQKKRGKEKAGYI